jgi:hypothetical protein
LSSKIIAAPEDQMKDGLIVYVVGDAELPEEYDLSRATLGQAADRVAIVAAQQGFFTVEDAWYALFTRGCGRISLMLAEVAAPSDLRPLGPAVRLYG